MQTKSANSYAGDIKPAKAIDLRLSIMLYNKHWFKLQSIFKRIFNHRTTLEAQRMIGLYEIKTRMALKK